MNMSVCPARTIIRLTNTLGCFSLSTATNPHEPVKEERWGSIEMVFQHEGQRRRVFHLCKHCGAVYSEDLE